jgi:hypothetical protein
MAMTKKALWMRGICQTPPEIAEPIEERQHNGKGTTRRKREPRRPTNKKMRQPGPRVANKLLLLHLKGVMQ